MQLSRRRKCCHCLELFKPDPRNRTRQKYCSKLDCRKISKKASQKKWLAKPENQTYFRSPENTQRVQEWRKCHPGYWRKKRSYENALQDHSSGKSTGIQDDKGRLMGAALQDLSFDYLPVLLGLMAHLSGTVLQDDIALFGRRMQQLGQDILSEPITCKGGRYDNQQTANLPTSCPPGT